MCEEGEEEEEEEEEVDVEEEEEDGRRRWHVQKQGPSQFCVSFEDVCVSLC